VNENYSQVTTPAGFSLKIPDGFFQKDKCKIGGWF